MTRRLTAGLTCAALVSLTLLTWWLADGGSPAWILALVALVKVTLVGAVFLELLHARPLWGVLFGSAVAVVLGGAVLLMG